MIASSRKKQFQGVTNDSLKVLGLTFLRLQFCALDVKHHVEIGDKINNKFILENDFFVPLQSDILNSSASIIFNGFNVSYTNFLSAVNLICTVVCQERTVIATYEKAVLPGLLNS